MYNVNGRRQRIPELITRVMPMVLLLRRWIHEGVIVVMMLILLLVEIGLRLTPGKHTVANVVVTGLLFGLTALWVHVNRAALAAWEQPGTEERDSQC